MAHGGFTYQCSHFKSSKAFKSHVASRERTNFSQLHLWSEVNVEVGCPHWNNMFMWGCAKTRNHAFQVATFLCIHWVGNLISIFLKKNWFALFRILVDPSEERNNLSAHYVVCPSGWLVGCELWKNSNLKILSDFKNSKTGLCSRIFLVTYKLLSRVL